MLCRSAAHSAFLPEVAQALEPGVPVSAEDFLFRAAPRVSETPVVQGEAPLGPLHKVATHRQPTQFLESPPASAKHTPDAATGVPQAFREQQLATQPEMRIQEAGLLGEHWGILKALKTTVLLTGGLCSKLFGIGLMGYLAFQSMQANVSRSRQEQMQMQGQYQYNNACGRRQDRA
mmetsp:Transcript_58/g.176  ORF Transcript_58/g.176 Transcript_58/m.176 type:complete len:176 (+) Transcript_58:96-623(+)